jgi:KDO2-lipid IV(A) lauroyltransferase
LSKPISQYYLELLSHFSLRFQYRFADFLAFFVSNTSNQISRQARENIALCLADLEPSEQKRIFRESIRHTCYALNELGAVFCWPADRIMGQVTSLDICEEFEQSTRGKIILTPHLGSWEMLGLWLGKNCDAMLLYKRRKNKALDQFINQARARNGGTPIPTKSHGLRKLLIGLKEGRNLLILPDQKPGKKKASIESEFFGADAPTTTLVRNLNSKIDCDVFLAAIYRSSPPGEFGLTIRPLERERLAADEASSAQYMNDQIEQLVRQFPEQYQWCYRRFSNSAYASVK